MGGLTSFPPSSRHVDDGASFQLLPEQKLEAWLKNSVKKWHI
ncbi:hypothetical protein [Candidatus Hecatella orcuttiae]|nr:hypothetical protein [Candidatus Hecatella orcuttiae]